MIEDIKMILYLSIRRSPATYIAWLMILVGLIMAICIGKYVLMGSICFGIVSGNIIQNIITKYKNKRKWKRYRETEDEDLFDFDK